MSEKQLGKSDSEEPYKHGLTTSQRMAISLSWKVYRSVVGIVGEIGFNDPRGKEIYNEARTVIRDLARQGKSKQEIVEELGKMGIKLS